MTSFIFANSFERRTVLCEAKGNAAENSLINVTCEPPLSDCEATVTVRLSPITGREKSIPAKYHKRPLPGLSGEVQTPNTKSAFLYSGKFGD